MKTMTKWVLASGLLLVGTHGCRQVIGWEEATYWGDQGGAGGASSSSSGEAGKAGAAGMAGMAGMGGMGGAGGMAGGGMGGMGGMPECVQAMDCPAVPNAMPTCTNNKCGFTCNNGFGDCTAAAGCETTLTNNRDHCGVCGNACVAYCAGTMCNDPVSIAGGYHHHCAVMKNGDVYCWGRNEKGELGDGTLASKSVPTKVKGLPGPAVQVDGGGSVVQNGYLARVCAVLANGDLWCWGDGSGVASKVTGLPKIQKVSLGNAHSCALDQGGALYCWGANSNGQVGNGSTGYVMLPFHVLSSVVVVDVSAGSQHTCAVTNSGAVHCWGNNSSGELGVGSTQDQYSPAIVNNIAGASNVRCGDSHTCALANGAIYCWGANLVGQLGTGNVAASDVPKLIDGADTTDIDVSYNFSAAIKGGSVMTWGYNGNGQIGNGTTMIAYKPQSIGLTNMWQLGLASISACALSSKGAAYCWGGNAYGQLGNNGNQQVLSPALVVWP